MNRFREYIILFSFLITAVIITFYKVFSGKMVFVSGDSLSPIAVREGIKHFMDSGLSYPLWLPWIFSGMPSIHSFTNISDLYYPHQFFLILNSFGLPWIWNFLIHIIFAGFGMYVLLRYFSCSKASAIIASVLFMLSPYMVTMTVFGHGSQVMTASYIPLIIFYLFRLTKNYKKNDLLVFSLLLGLQLQRGHIQIAYYTWMMIGLFILLHNIEYLRDKTKQKFILLKENIYLFIALILGLLLSFNIYLPVLNYMNNSTRNSIKNDSSLDYATQWSFSLGESLTMLFPYFRGFGGQTYTGSMPFTDYPNYIGILVIFIGIIGFLKSSLNKNFKIFFLLVAIFSFLISLGHNFISFYKIFYNLLPFFDRFRVPVYILILFYFSILFFFGLGLDMLVKSIKTREYRKYRFIVLSFIIICSFLFLNGNDLIRNDLLYIIFGLILFSLLIEIFKKYGFRESYIYLPLGLLLFFDYTRINLEIINPQKHRPNKVVLKNKEYVDNFKKKDSLVEFLLNDSNKFRIFDILGPQNRWSQFNIENVNGYHPAKLNSYNKLITMIQKRGYKIWPESILKQLNVKYLIMPYDNFDYPGFKKIHSGNMFYFGYDPNYDGKKINSYIYLYEDFYPRFYFTKDIKFLDEKNIFDEILKDHYDPIQVSYMNVHSQKDLNFKFDENASIEILSYEPDKIIFKTIASEKQFLIMSEIYYENGWSLNSVNAEHEIFKVNNFLRGALIPSGEHTFEMCFKPKDVILGKYLSLSVFVIVIFSFFLIKRKDYDKF